MTLVIMPPMEGLSRPGQNCIAVFCLSVTMWVTQFVPLPVTGLLVFFLLPVLGVLPSSRAFSLLGSNAVFFILGAFVIAAAMMSSGLSKRLALLFLSRFGSSPRSLLLGVLLSSAFLSFWMPEHAVAAMMFPIVLEIADSLNLKPLRSQYGKALFLSLAWGAIIGGIATYLGGARNPLAIGMLYDTYEMRIGFLEWMVASVPAVSLMLLVAFKVNSILFRGELTSVEPARKVLELQIRNIGKMSLRERKVAGVFLGTVILWVFFSKHLGLANIAILSSVSLFVIKAVNWKVVEHYVNWGLILMYGGAIALGSSLASTQAADWVAVKVLSSLFDQPLLFISVMALITLILTEFISNVAALAIILPVAFGFCTATGTDPKLVVLAVALSSGLAFAFPIGTPPNAIAFSSGYYSISDSLKGGIILNLISWLMIVAVLVFYWPHLSFLN